MSAEYQDQNFARDFKSEPKHKVSTTSVSVESTSSIQISKTSSSTASSVTSNTEDKEQISTSKELETKVIEATKSATGVEKPVLSLGDDINEPEMLQLIVHSGSDLVNTDLVGKSDPYVVVYYQDKEYKSKTVKNSLNPVWDFVADFPVNKYNTDKIIISVFDNDIEKDDAMGTTALSVQELLESGNVSNKLIKLDECRTGNLCVSYRSGCGIVSPDTAKIELSKKPEVISEISKEEEANIEKLPADKDSLVIEPVKIIGKTMEMLVGESEKLEPEGQEMVQLTIHRGTDLVNTDIIGKSDPYVVVKYLDMEFKSETVKNSLNPVWDFVVDLPVYKNKTDDICISVFDKDVDKDDAMGTTVLEVKNLLQNGNFENKLIMLDQCKSGTLNVSYASGGLILKPTNVQPDKTQDSKKSSATDKSGLDDKELVNLMREQEELAKLIPKEILQNLPKELSLALQAEISEQRLKIVQDATEKGKSSEKKMENSPKISTEQSAKDKEVGVIGEIIELVGDLDELSSKFVYEQLTLILKEVDEDAKHEKLAEMREELVQLQMEQSKLMPTIPEELKASLPPELAHILNKEMKTAYLSIAENESMTSAEKGKKTVDVKSIDVDNSLESSTDMADLIDIQLEQNMLLQNIPQELLENLSPELKESLQIGVSEGIKEVVNEELKPLELKKTSRSGSLKLKIEKEDKEDVTDDDVSLPPTPATSTSWATVLIQPVRPHGPEPLTPTTEETKQISADNNTESLSETSLPGDKYEGQVSLRIIRAKELEKMDIFKKCDPFVIISYKGEEFKTDFVKNTFNPSWEKEIALRITKDDQNIKLKVVDWERIGNNEPMGEITLNIPETIKNTVAGPKWFKLEKCQTGSVLLSLEGKPLEKTTSIEDTEDDKVEYSDDETEVVYSKDSEPYWTQAGEHLEDMDGFVIMSSETGSIENAEAKIVLNPDYKNEEEDIWVEDPDSGNTSEDEMAKAKIENKEEQDEDDDDVSLPTTPSVNTPWSVVVQQPSRPHGPIPSNQESENVGNPITVSKSEENGDNAEEENYEEVEEENDDVTLPPTPSINTPWSVIVQQPLRPHGPTPSHSDSETLESPITALKSHLPIESDGDDPSCKRSLFDSDVQSNRLDIPRSEYRSVSPEVLEVAQSTVTEIIEEAKKKVSQLNLQSVSTDNREIENTNTSNADIGECQKEEHFKEESIAKAGVKEQMQSAIAENIIEVVGDIRDVDYGDKEKESLPSGGEEVELYQEEDKNQKQRELADNIIEGIGEIKDAHCDTKKEESLPSDVEEVEFYQEEEDESFARLYMLTDAIKSRVNMLPQSSFDHSYRRTEVKRFASVEEIHSNVTEDITHVKQNIRQRKVIIVQKTIITIVETVSKWLDNVEYKILKVKQISSVEEKKHELKNIRNEIEIIEETVDKVVEVTEMAVEIMNDETKITITSCVDSLREQVRTVKSFYQQSEEELEVSEDQWEDFLEGIKMIESLVKDLKSTVETIEEKDEVSEESVEALSELETSSKGHRNKLTYLIMTGKGLENMLPENKVPDNLIELLNDSKDIESEIQRDREKIINLILSKQEYEDTLEEFEDVFFIAETFFVEHFSVLDLMHLNEELVRRKRFFLNLSHCLQILDSNQERLGEELRSFYREKHQSINQRGYVVLKRGCDHIYTLDSIITKWSNVNRKRDIMDKLIDRIENDLTSCSELSSSVLETKLALVMHNLSSLQELRCDAHNLGLDVETIQRNVESPELNTVLNSTGQRISTLISLYKQKLYQLKEFSMRWDRYETTLTTIQTWLAVVEDQEIQDQNQLDLIQAEFETYSNLEADSNIGFYQALGKTSIDFPI